MAALPFSSAVRVGDMLYLSGQIGFGPDGKLPDGHRGTGEADAGEYRRDAEGAGLGFGDVFHCTAMLADMKPWPAFNAVYRDLFPRGKLPARSAFGASGLALGGLVELDARPTRERSRRLGSRLLRHRQSARIRPRVTVSFSPLSLVVIIEWPILTGFGRPATSPSLFIALVKQALSSFITAVP